MLALASTSWLPCAAELNVRIGGYALTLVGIVVVVQGIRSKARRFERPSIVLRVWNWWKRVCAVFVAPEPQTVSLQGHLNVGVEGSAHVSSRPGPTASPEQRLRHEDLARPHHASGFLKPSPPHASRLSRFARRESRSASHAGAAQSVDRRSIASRHVRRTFTVSAAEHSAAPDRAPNANPALKRLARCRPRLLRFPARVCARTGELQPLAGHDFLPYLPAEGILPGEVHQ
jgi:hypothetical protein